MEPVKEQVLIKGISGSTLKIIAIISMLIDHTAAIVMERMLLISYQSSGTQIGKFYLPMRMVGRLGFPIFIFLLIEGFVHTRNVKKYVGRMAVFAIISEIPFDLAFAGKAIYFGYQNVFFTLLIGLLVIVGFQWIENKGSLNRIVVILTDVVIAAAGMMLADFLRTDYSSIGVAIIALLYLCRKKKLLLIIAGCIAFSWEPAAMLAFIPIALYNGRRGLNLKYFFYAFYPLHILILYFVSIFMGLGDVYMYMQ